MFSVCQSPALGGGRLPTAQTPLWLASPPSSGRWQQGETLAAIYLADEEEDGVG